MAEHVCVLVGTNILLVIRYLWKCWSRRIDLFHPNHDSDTSHPLVGIDCEGRVNLISLPRSSSSFALAPHSLALRSIHKGRPQNFISLLDPQSLAASLTMEHQSMYFLVNPPPLFADDVLNGWSPYTDPLFPYQNMPLFPQWRVFVGQTDHLKHNWNWSVHCWAEKWSPGCVNFLGKLRHKR